MFVIPVGAPFWYFSGLTLLLVIKKVLLHKVKPLMEGIMHGSSLNCCLLNGKIDLVSGETISIDQGCVNTFPVKIKNSHVYIELDN